MSSSERVSAACAALIVAVACASVARDLSSVAAYFFSRYEGGLGRRCTNVNVRGGTGTAGIFSCLRSFKDGVSIRDAQNTAMSSFGGMGVNVFGSRVRTGITSGKSAGLAGVLV